MYSYICADPIEISVSLSDNMVPINVRRIYTDG